MARLPLRLAALEGALGLAPPPVEELGLSLERALARAGLALGRALRLRLRSGCGCGWLWLGAAAGAGSKRLAPAAGGGHLAAIGWARRSARPMASSSGIWCMVSVMSKKMASAKRVTFLV